MKTDINFCFCEAPWLSDQEDINDEVSGRSFVVLSDEITNVVAMPAGTRLPFAGDVQKNHKCYKRFELPACLCDQSEGGIANTTIQLRLYDANNKFKGIASVNMTQNTTQLITDSYDSTEQAEEDEFAISKAFLNTYIDHINNSFSSIADDEPFSWQRNIGDIAIRPQGRFLRDWQKLGDQDVPRMSLIVKLAKKTPTLIRSLANNPRRILKRQREMVDMDRVQQIDQAGMRWLARQPGISIVEKAGIKREVLAVTRIEHYDIPENRVVKDFIIRSISACKKYLNDYKEIRHPNVYNIKIFLRLLNSLLANTIIATVSSLTSIAKANYVLLHDTRYNALWKYYQMLIRQEKQQDDAWIWRHRLWAEICQVSFETMIALISDYESLSKPEIVFFDEHLAGKFMHPHCSPTKWITKVGCKYQSIFIVNNSYIGNENNLKKALEIYGNLDLFDLNPDFVVIKKILNSDSCQLMPVWCIFDDVPNNSLIDINTFITLKQKLSRIKTKGILILPNFNDTIVKPFLYDSWLQVINLNIKDVKKGDKIFDVLAELMD